MSLVQGYWHYLIREFVKKKHTASRPLFQQAFNTLRKNRKFLRKFWPCHWIVHAGCQILYVNIFQFLKTTKLNIHLQSPAGSITATYSNTVWVWSRFRRSYGSVTGWGMALRQRWISALNPVKGLDMFCLESSQSGHWTSSASGPREAGAGGNNCVKLLSGLNRDWTGKICYRPKKAMEQSQKVNHLQSQLALCRVDNKAMFVKAL